MLVNPSAGPGHATRIAALASHRLSDAGFQVTQLQGEDAEEAEEQARGAVGNGCESVVVVGGDGLVHCAANALAHTTTVLGIIPAGTGNDAARSLGIPRRDPRQATDVVIAGRSRTVDLARAEAEAGSAYFLCVLSAGFDAMVNERANSMGQRLAGRRWWTGRLRYTLATLAELRRLRPMRYTLELDGHPRELDAVLVAVGNGPSFGGGLQLTTGALLDDGLVDVVLVHPVTKADLVRTYPRLYRGSHTGHPAYEHHRVRTVRIAGPPIVAYADGERLAPLPMTVRAVPAALQVWAPV